MRILFIIDSLGFGGAERQLVELVKGLSRKESYKIYLISLERSEKGYVDIVGSLGIDIHYFARAWKYDIVAPIFSIVHFIHQHRIDIIHTFMNMGSLFGALSAKIARKPVVCSAIRDAKDSSLREKYIKRLISFLADIYVANSRAGFANRFKKMRTNFYVVYNGVDFARFNEKGIVKEALREELGISHYEHIVGMTASLSMNKDHVTLLMAARKVLEIYPKTGFLLVGDGENRIRLENLSKKLGIDSQVVFAGFRKDVDYLYPLMDVFVLQTNSNVHLEGIPNAVIESMLCGVPVIASAGGGIAEVVEHNKTGIIVPPQNPKCTADYILRLLSDYELSRYLTSKARTRVTKLFRLERYVNEYHDLYKEALYKRR